MSGRETKGKEKKKTRQEPGLHKEKVGNGVDRWSPVRSNKLGWRVISGFLRMDLYVRDDLGTMVSMYVQ